MTSRFHMRPAQQPELPALSALCLRSKAYWGYDAAFIEACIPALTLTDADLDPTFLAVADANGVAAGVAQLTGPPGAMEIDRFFVDPPFIGSGCGRVMWDWCVRTAKTHGETRLSIEADPGATGFYEKMGAVVVGHAQSEVFKDRMLPLLELRL